MDEEAMVERFFNDVTMFGMVLVRQHEYAYATAWFEHYGEGAVVVRISGQLYFVPKDIAEHELPVLRNETGLQYVLASHGDEKGGATLHLNLVRFYPSPPYVDVAIIATRLVQLLDEHVMHIYRITKPYKRK